MNERVVTFGADNNLVGILTQPEVAPVSSERPVVVILNAGILHHVGPFRLHVLLARTLATEGYASLRMDVSGIGDSPQVNSTGYDEQAIIADVRAGLDLLQNTLGASCFVAVGLCTGAANTHNVMVADPRVRGAVFLDGYAYPTRSFYVRRYGSVLHDPLRLLKSGFGSICNRLTGWYGKKNTLDAADFGWWILPPKKKMLADLEIFMERKNQLLYIHSGDRREFYNYPDQLRDAFPSIDFEGRLSVILNSQADHTYSTCAERQRLPSQICHWLNSWSHTNSDTNQ